MQVNCNYLKIEEISTVFSFISFVLLMINIRRCRKNFDNFIAHFSNVISYFRVLCLLKCG